MNDGPTTGENLAKNPAQGVAASTGDRSFDLSLRLLTILVLIALTASVSLLGYRWLAPRFSHDDGGPLNARSSRPPPAPAGDDRGPSAGDQVLMAPGRVFRCEEQGRVSFSDQACPERGPARKP